MRTSIRDFRLETIVLVLGMVFFSFPLSAQTELIEPNQSSTTSESQEEEPVLEAEFPTPDARGNYKPSSPVHPMWEIVDRGLSGLNCYRKIGSKAPSF